MMSSIKRNEAQQKVLDSRGNILVNASAGSGKTSVMIDKVMQLLLGGVDIRKILLMTFTKASAAEMRERLIKKIYENIRENSSSSTILLNQLDNLPFGNICTIDSFCYGIFQKYFALIKRDPSCVLIEPAQSNLLLLEIIDNVLEEYINSDDKDFLILAKHFSSGRRIDDLKDTIIYLNRFVNSQKDMDHFVNTVLTDEYISKAVFVYFKKYFDRRVAELINSTYIYMRIVLNEKYTEEYNQTKEILDSLQQVKDSEDIKNAMILLINTCNYKTTLKNKDIELKEERKDYYDCLKDAKNEFIEFLEEFINQKEYCSNESKKIIEVLFKVRNLFLDYKVKHNVVDFGDLKYYTLKILESDTAKEEIRENFDYIFIDEYQDTDDMQEKILSSICKDDNVFVVGDMKQAIYHFRYAEPEIFNNRMRSYDNLKKGENITLSVNYRSDGEILKFVNVICNEIMTLDFCDIDYKNQGALAAGKEFEKVNDQPICSINTYVEGKSNEDKSGYYSVKEDIIEEDTYIEGEFIANKIKELADNVEISDKDGKRKVEYKDIAILTSRRSIWKRFLTELDKKGIPYNISDKLKKKDEDRELLVDFIRLLNNMAQDIPLGNVLMSQMFNFTIEELLTIEKENKQSNFYQSFITYMGNENLMLKIDNFKKEMEEYRFKSSYMKVSDLLINVMSKGFDAYLLAKGKAAIEKVNSFIHFISGVPQNDNLEDFIEYYENTYEGNNMVAQNNAVTITTIHQSKGLEYPIVFLAGVDTSTVGGGNVNQTKIFTDKNLGIAIKYFDDDKCIINDTFATAVFKLKIKQEERQEMARLLYVALTRAKNHLYISGKVPNNVKTKDKFKANSFMDMLIFVKQNNGGFGKYWEDIVIAESTVVNQKESIVNQENIDLSSLDVGYKYGISTHSPAKYSVTQLLHNEDNEAKKLFASTDIDIGICYHTFMQHIDYNATDMHKINIELDRMVSERIFTPNQVESMDKNILLNILNSEIIELARNSKCLREQPFILYTDTIENNNMKQGKALVQGVIDLVILGKEAVLVDFKASYGTPKYLIDKYSRQLDLYAEAVEKVLKYKVGKKVIFNIIRGFAVDI
jgi:ATP-dependent helicase/nuclease subunit A